MTDYFHNRPRIMNSTEAIRDYMFRWPTRAGPSAVFSRSLGWVDDPDMRAMLEAKAADGELTLVMPTVVPRSKQLEARGAKATYYGGGDYVVRSRFTIINRGRTHTAVAIGRSDPTGRHIVTEYRASSGDPAYWLAEDLIELMLRHDSRNSDRRAS